MTSQPKPNIPTVKKILEYWHIIVFIGLVVFTWSALKSVQDDNVRRITILEKKVEVQSTTAGEIKTQLSQIQTDIQWIKLNLAHYEK